MQSATGILFYRQRNLLYEQNLLAIFYLYPSDICICLGLYMDRKETVSALNAQSASLLTVVRFVLKTELLIKFCRISSVCSCNFICTTVLQ